MHKEKNERTTESTDVMLVVSFSEALDEDGTPSVDISYSLTVGFIAFWG